MKEEKQKKKLYVPQEDASAAKAERYIYLVGTVICLCAGLALAALSFDMFRNSHIIGGVAAAIPALAGIVCGIICMSTMNKYKADQLRLQREETDRQAEQENPEAAEEADDGSK